MFILPEGGFSKRKEFFASDGKEVFKTFEYWKLGISDEELFKAVKRAREEGKKVSETLKGWNNIKEKLEKNDLYLFDSFAKEFAEAVMRDVKLGEMSKEAKDIEDKAAAFSLGWLFLQGFYTLEWLTEEGNFERPSNNSGALDLVEISDIDPEDDEAVLLISYIVQRDPGDIKEGIKVLQKVRQEKSIPRDKAVENLKKMSIDNSGDVARYFNTLLRFHNWLPAKLNSFEGVGGTTDSICTLARELVEELGIEDYVKTIKDATSPKGHASLLKLAERGKSEEIWKKIEKKFSSYLKALGEFEENFEVISLDSSFAYLGLVGGKFLGLWILKKAKELLKLSYEIPEAHVVTTLVKDDEKKIEIAIELSKSFNKAIVRSSAVVEDFMNSFAGVFESSRVTSRDDVRKVLESYREFGLENQPVIVQKFVEGKGGVIFLEEGNVTISYASSPEEAVKGNAEEVSGKSFRDAVSKIRDEEIRATLSSYASDLEKLYEVFGSVDIEYAVSDSKLYLLQMRRKRKPSAIEVIGFPEKLQKVSLQNLPERVSEEYIELDGPENPNDAIPRLYRFLEENDIKGVVGKWPRTSHIANVIEALGIAYWRKQ